MFTKNELFRLTEGVKLFNQKKYWECHEEVEDLWLEEASPVRLVYWAIIQVATALYHFEGGNEVGAIDMLYKGKDKIVQAQKAHVKSELLTKFLSWKRFSNLVLETQEGKEIEVIKKLLEFRFPDPDKWRKHFE